MNIKSNFAGNLFAFFIMLFSFFVMLFFVTCYINIYSYMQTFTKSNTMIVFLKNSKQFRNKAFINNLMLNIKRIHGIKKIKYYTDLSSLKFLTAHVSKIKSVLMKINPKYFPPFIKIYFNPNYISSIYLSNIYLRIKSFNGVKYVYYSKLLIDKIIQFLFFTKIIGLIIFLFLFMLSISISYSAIKLIILRKQNEIEILKLIGATNNYIRIPMFIEVGIGTITSFIISLILLFGIFNIFIHYHFNDFLSYFKIHIIFLNFFEILAVFIIAILSGFLGTYFSSRKFF